MLTSGFSSSLKALHERPRSHQQPGSAGAAGVLEGVGAVLRGWLQPHHEETRVRSCSQVTSHLSSRRSNVPPLLQVQVLLARRAAEGGQRGEQNERVSAGGAAGEQGGAVLVRVGLLYPGLIKSNSGPS